MIALLSCLLLVFLATCTGLINEVLVYPVSQLPQPYEVPLPEECTVPGSHTRSFNQGQCSRSPCTTTHGPCASSLNCCYEVGQTTPIEFLCSKSTNRLKASVIVTCTCQVCDKLHTTIAGRVLSSRGLKPVVLATIMIGSEVATLSDESGFFSFELSTSNGYITLEIQETKHRSVKQSVNIRHSVSPEINVVLEHIQDVVLVDAINSDFAAKLSSPDGSVSIVLGSSQRTLFTQTTGVYEGSGQVLYSVYVAEDPPAFTSPALNSMIYTDSKGTEFTLQTLVLLTMELLSENGRQLTLRPGSTLTLRAQLEFSINVRDTDVSKLHLFVYSESKHCWLDSGRMGVTSIQRHPTGYGSTVTLQQAIHELNSMLAIASPVKVTCHVKAVIASSVEPIPSALLSVSQADSSLGRAAFYNYTELSGRDGSACLKAVCAIGGTVQVNGLKEVRAVPPSVDVGMVMNNKDKIVFYESDSTSAPYYPTRSQCESSTKNYLQFTSNSSTTQTTPVKPTMEPVKNVLTDNFCFVKVSVYDCAPLTEVKVLSYSPGSHDNLLSMHTGVAKGTSMNTCSSAEVVGVRATCVEFSCGGDIHVTAQSQNHYSWGYSRSSTGHSVDCRYWSSNKNLNSGHPSENMKSYHLSDDGTLPMDSGVYWAGNPGLAKLRCLTGREESPGNLIDPLTGVAVVFTCLF